jgi:hypothetical protein
VRLEQVKQTWTQPEDVGDCKLHEIATWSELAKSDAGWNVNFGTKIAD